MTHHLLRILQIAAPLGCLSSCSYYLLSLWSAAEFLRTRKVGQNSGSASALPPVSILKPLKGTDPAMYESLRGHCAQDYSDYEIIFGMSDPADPAVPIVQRLQREFPNRSIQLVISSSVLGPNIKVSNLEHMLAATRHEFLLINDSDISVESDYLTRIVTPLTDPAVGMVTCLYRAAAGPTLGSRLELLGIETDFSPGVLVAGLIEGGLHFGLGSTLAFRRGDLERIGGFRSIADFLADDYELGRRIAGLGLEVRLSDVVVETHLPAYDLRGFLAHQMRWARGVRDSRAGGYVGLVFTFGLLWGLLALIAAPLSSEAWTEFAVTVALRLAVAVVIGRLVLRDRDLLRHLWLLPVRDLVGVAVWVASFAGNTVTWRGDRFELKKGRLVPISR